jgi:hypothetical protein
LVRIKEDKYQGEILIFVQVIGIQVREVQVEIIIIKVGLRIKE